MEESNIGPKTLWPRKQFSQEQFPAQYPVTELPAKCRWICLAKAFAGYSLIAKCPAKCISVRYPEKCFARHIAGYATMQVSNANSI